MRVSVYLVPGQQLIALRSRAEGPGDASALFLHEVRPGQFFLGWSYDELRALGTAMHDLEPKPGPAPQDDRFLPTSHAG
ncbi:MAG: hypothetical protein K2R98_08595 [Gemmataceae bacterium]|nr:hypothetical protein [Gemmataceae bacterium]